MLALEWIAERKIAEAIALGEFDDLPGTGRPLPPEEIDPLVPDELRMAYRILKNAGFAPRELEGTGKGAKKLSLLNARIEARYFGKAVRKLNR